MAVKQRNCILGKGDAHTLEGDWMWILNWHSSGSRLATGGTGVRRSWLSRGKDSRAPSLCRLRAVLTHFCRNITLGILSTLCNVSTIFS